MPRTTWKARERELLDLFYHRMSALPQVQMIGDPDAPKIGCVSFNITGIHYNLVVRLLNDRFGIQVRGGWSCASTFSHFLFGLDDKNSQKVMEGIRTKDLTEKPGWVRLSLHPVLLDQEVEFVCDAIQEIIENIAEWRKDYKYNPQTNEFDSLVCEDPTSTQIKEFFVL